MPKHPEVPKIDQFPVRNPNRKVWPSSAPLRVFRWSNCGEWLPCSDLFVKPSRRECNYQNQIQIANNARHPGLGKSSKTNRKKEEKDAVVLQGVSLILYCKKISPNGVCYHLHPFATSQNSSMPWNPMSGTIAHFSAEIFQVIQWFESLQWLYYISLVSAKVRNPALWSGQFVAFLDSDLEDMATYNLLWLQRQVGQRSMLPTLSLQTTAWRSATPPLIRSGSGLLTKTGSFFRQGWKEYSKQ